MCVVRCFYKVRIKFKIANFIMNDNLLLYEPCLYTYMVCVMITLLYYLNRNTQTRNRETFVEI